MTLVRQGIFGGFSLKLKLNVILGKGGSEKFYKRKVDEEDGGGGY